jgi:hypothetical protein
LPPPIDSIVQDIYQSYDGSDEENQGEEHYNKIVPKLDKVISGMDQLKDNAAKQKTLLEVKDIIIRQDNNIKQKLDQIITGSFRYSQKL